MVDIETEVAITKDLLVALGLEIDPNTNAVIDQETKNQLHLDDLIIKANNDPLKGLYISKYDIKLEPLNPECTKLLEKLFDKFLNDEEELGNIPHALTYFFDKKTDEETDLTMNLLNIKFEDGSKYTGEWRYNKIICFDEAIFKLEGTFNDKNLSEYDVPQEDKS